VALESPTNPHVVRCCWLYSKGGGLFGIGRRGCNELVTWPMIVLQYVSIGYHITNQTPYVVAPSISDRTVHATCLGGPRRPRSFAPSELTIIPAGKLARPIFASSKSLIRSLPVWSFSRGTSDKSSRHAPLCRPPSEICRDSRWTAHGMCLLL
jgi:hypothetical protein